MNTIAQYTGPGILLTLTFVFGVWLSLSGKPYNGLLFNIHKLAALGLVVLAALQIYPAFMGRTGQPALPVLLVLAAVTVVALFATGAVMSLGKLNYHTMLAIHRAALLLLPTTLVLALYLINGSSS